MDRGEIWWAVLRSPRASEPGYRRPVVVIQSDAFNRSKMRTVIVAVVTSSMRLARAPGNVKLTPKQSGLPKPSVVNVSQVVTLDKSHLVERVGKVAPSRLRAVDAGLRLVISL
jgi:mRNA interferase MazF